MWLLARAGLGGQRGQRRTLQGIPIRVGSQGAADTQHALLGGQRVSVAHFVGALTEEPCQEPHCCESCGELGRLGWREGS